MNIAILGGGLTGLSASGELAAAGHTVTVFEKNKELGGLAGGTKRQEWEWYLDYTYHHVFTSDTAILKLASQIKHPFTFATPHTDTLFGERNNYRIFPVDTPQNLLLLPELSLLSRLRTGAVLAFLKLSPFILFYEKNTAAIFIKKTMGEESWYKLWGPLFRKKFGEYAEIVVASFMWARINKRSRALGYPEGGFQAFVNRLGTTLQEKGVVLQTASSVVHIGKNNRQFVITDGGGEQRCYDKVVVTAPFPVFLTLAKDILPNEYYVAQKKRKYLWAVNMIVQTNKPILPHTYWLNVNAQDVPVMCVVQHTNFVSTKHFNNKHIAYFAWYVKVGDPLLSMTQEEVLTQVKGSIGQINPAFHDQSEVVSLFRASFAQPIFDQETAGMSHSCATPVSGLYIANLDMTYPFDRGTNYAVQLGKDVSNLVLNTL